MSFMSTLSQIFLKGKDLSFRKFWLIAIALFAGLILSILSWLELCVEHCSANQDFRLFGFPFAIVGMSFFFALLLLHFLSKKYVFLERVVSWLIAMAVGAEVVFIAIQHYQIGHWCPVCLSIAASVLFAGVVLAFDYFRKLIAVIQRYSRGDFMLMMKRGILSLFFIFFGTVSSFAGVSQFNPAEAAVTNMKEKMAFGLNNSPVVVYYVTDWFCPACRKIEGDFEQLYPKIKDQVTVYFIDYAIHKNSLNFTPYNLAFLVNNKSQYFTARNLLLNLSDKTESPNDEEVEHAAREKRVPFKELSYLDVKAGIEFFDSIVTKYDLRSTPTILITRPGQNKVIKLEGRDEISSQKVLEGIERLKK